VPRKKRAVRRAAATSTGFFQRSLVRLGDANYRQSVTPNGHRSLVVAAVPAANSNLYVSKPHSLRLAVPVSSVPPPTASSVIARARALVSQAKLTAAKTASSVATTTTPAAPTPKHSHVVRDFRQPCIFFVRFGECKLGDKCRYAHPRDKVAVCRAFLRGNCALGGERCKLSHVVEPSKMPMCRHFLKGRCTKGASCEYRHVRVADDAPVCEEFLKGWCPLGLQCTKHHTHECISFMRHGKCERGDSCRMLHVVDSDDAAEPDAAASSTAARGKVVHKRKRNADAAAAPAKKRTVDIMDSSSTAPILIALKQSFDDDSDDDDDNDGSNMATATTISANGERSLKSAIDL
jgi:hypothetical protein